MEPVKRIAAIHDLSCFGRCSLTVALPVLSAMGHQCCPLPTAVLSTHTGGFEGIARTDLTEQLSGALNQWRSLGLAFDCVYTGYLASAEQLTLAAEAVEGLGGLTVVDPVLGDHGRLYRSFTPDMVGAMAGLCQKADLITPNLTEAALLLGREDLPHEGGALARLLSREGRRSVVVTGVSDAPGRLGAAWYDRETGRTGVYTLPRVEGAYPGTGDLFTSVLTGSVLAGKPLEEAAALAVGFVRRCVERTRASARPAREGVEFEPLLRELS